MHTIRYKGCVAQQDNKTKHVTIYKDGRMVMHAQKSEKLSGKELRGLVNQYLSLAASMEG